MNQPAGDEHGDDEGPATNGALEPRMHRLHRSLTALTQHVQWMGNRLDQLVDRVDTLDSNSRGEANSRKDQPAPWVLYSPPAAAEDTHHRGDELDPRFTLANFVAWYNTIYTGLPGTRAVPIPDCWTQHPALVMEIATLAYTWREANIGPDANPRDAQQWHDRWLPGFTERLSTQWTHPHCRDGNHRPAGTASRSDRYCSDSSHPNGTR